MAAQSSSASPGAAAPGGPRDAVGDGARPTSAAAAAAMTLAAARRKSVVSDPDELLLLREKLNQIAVGLRFRASAPDDDDDGGDNALLEDYDEESERLRRRRRQQNGSGHFKVFPLLGERPSTPPSSPQPRDVLRKQLRLRNSSFRLDDLPSFHSSSNNRSSSAGASSDSAMAGVSVDTVEIARFEDAQLPHVRLSIPGHLRVRSASSFSVLTKNPEGMRKRKSADQQHPDAGDAGPLKKVSSEKNVLAAAAWDYDAVAAARGNQAPRRRPDKDHEMEDVSPESAGSTPYDSDLEKLCS